MKSSRLKKMLPCVIPVLVAGVFALTACAPGADNPVTADQMAPVVTTHTDVTDPLVIAINARPGTLDPLTVTAAHDVRLLQMMGGTLFSLAPDSSGATPSLASGSELSDDGLRYQVALADGATFTDGTPLTPADVVATFQRAQTFESNAYLAQIAPVDTVVAVDEKTVEFTFNRPYPSFETFLAYPNMTILKADEIAGDLSVPKVPTFAGPYLIDGDYFSGSFSLVRNGDFVGAIPAADQLDVTVVTDANSRVQQVRTGQVDFAIDPLPNQLESLGGDALPQVTPSVGFYYLNMNNKGEILSDTKVRKAISLALDRAQLAAIASGGSAEPMSGFFPPAFAEGYEGDVERDVQGATKLLAGSSCESGCDLSLLASEEWAQQAGVIVQQNLAEIGITVTIESVEAQVEIERLFASEFDLGVGLFGDYSSAPEGLPAFCMQPSAGYLSCLSGYESPDAEAAVEKLSLALTDSEKTQAMDEVNDVFLADQPYATISGLTAAAVVSKDAAGVISMGSTNFIHVATLAE